MQIKYYYHTAAILLLQLIICASCSKLVQIPQPVNTITTNETFKTEANANSALVGIYGSMVQPPNGIGCGIISRWTAVSSDELAYFDVSDPLFLMLQTNTIEALPLSYTINTSLWAPIFYSIYQANAAIEGIAASSLSGQVKTRLTGEAKFLRGFCNFYLINLFGAVPLVMTTRYAAVDTMHRTPIDIVYGQIVKDLIDAKDALADDYTISKNERIRVNKYAASALLARVYLFMGNYAAAEMEATDVINNRSLYQLEGNLNTVFAINSKEAIWQLQISDSNPWATQDGNQFIPVLPGIINPRFYLTDQLLSAFEPADKRRINWVSSTDFSGSIYYYPFKYKIRQGDPGNVSEYYTVLRLAEQYLIRAESRAQQNKDTKGAIADLNIIRERAGLEDLPWTLDQAQILQAVAQERRIELFSEWGHRWFDLKRTGKASSVLSQIKPQWKPTQALYPIPVTELQSAPNLIQNEGY